EVQWRLWDEVEAVLGGRAATLEDLPRLTFADRGGKEALRLCPPTVALINREAVTEAEGGRYRPPPGGLATPSPHLTQRDPRWFPARGRFDSDRFAPGRVGGIPEYAYFPFGAGPHVCVGNSFAMMEITLVVATIAQRFQLELAPGQANLVPELKVSLRPKGGVWVMPAERWPREPGGAPC